MTALARVSSALAWAALLVLLPLLVYAHFEPPAGTVTTRVRGGTVWHLYHLGEGESAYESHPRGWAGCVACHAAGGGK